MMPRLDGSNAVRFEVSRRFYGLRLLAELAGEFSDRAEVAWSVKGRRIAVTVSAAHVVGTQELWALAGELANEWLNRQCRVARVKRGGKEAVLVVARAFSSALAPAPQPVDAR